MGALHRFTREISMNRPFRVLAICLASALSCAANAFESPLTLPAKSIPQPEKSPLFAVAHLGSRTVAVGRHGIIIYKDDGANQWRQATVPVSNDLASVSFGSPRKGWAVGHGGVVLHSADGGATWAKQLDGKMAGAVALAHYQSKTDNLKAEQRDVLLGQTERWAKEETSQPFLDVWFRNDSTGYIVGTFNRIMRTDDAGKQWFPLIDKIDNPDELHFYAVRGRGEEIYVAGESGAVWRWNESTGRFISIKTPYNGSLFGLVLTDRAVLAFGMRGSLFRTLDRGATWEKIATGIRGGIVAGDVRPNGDIVLASQSGEVLSSSDNGATFKLVSKERLTPVAGLVTFSNGGFATAGPAGANIELPGTRVAQTR